MNSDNEENEVPEEIETVKVVIPKKRVMTEKQLLALKKGREKAHARGLLRNKETKTTLPNYQNAPTKTRKEIMKEELDKLKEEQEYELEKLKILNDYDKQKKVYKKKKIIEPESESESEYETDSDDENNKYNTNFDDVIFG